MHDTNVGESVRVSVRFTDSAGQPIAATGVRIAAKRPDRSVVEGAVTPGAGVGEFEARFVADMPGVWLTLAECAAPEVVRDEGRFAVSRMRWDEP